jgi:cation transporter-like permease
MSAYRGGNIAEEEERLVGGHHHDTDIELSDMCDIEEGDKTVSANQGREDEEEGESEEFLSDNVIVLQEEVVALRQCIKLNKLEFPSSSSSSSSSSPLPLEKTPGYLQERSFFIDFVDRGLWLVGLLLVQSCSTFILARNEKLIKDHPAVVFFLTMLVGAGGNAGNQAAVIMVRALALSVSRKKPAPWYLLSKEVFMATGLTFFIGGAGLVRVAFSPHTDVAETVAITLSLSIIVFVSILLGALLPFILDRAGLDPAHSSTSIQVIMDVSGVFLTCGITHLLLSTDIGEFILGVVGIVE